MTVLIASCSLIPKKEVIKPIPIKITQPILPRGIDLKEPHWYVVSKANLDEFLKNVEKEHNNLVFFAMSVPDYELMAYNMQEMRRYIKELQSIIVYYREVTQNGSGNSSGGNSLQESGDTASGVQ